MNHRLYKYSILGTLVLLALLLGACIQEPEAPLRGKWRVQSVHRRIHRR